MFWIGRLAVVMRVNEYGARRAGHFPFTVDSGRRVWSCAFEQAWAKSALLHHLDDERGVLADVFSVARDVRNRKKGGELFQDLVFVCTPEVANFFLRGLGKKRDE